METRNIKKYIGAIVCQVKKWNSGSGKCGIDAEYHNRVEVERLNPRVDGKKICEQLKQMRIAVAKANNISYTPVNCQSNGPCAGTCEQCDRELRYLKEQLDKLPKELRIFPIMDLGYQGNIRQEIGYEYVRAWEEHYPHRLTPGVLPRTVKKTKLEVPKSIKRRNSVSKGDKK